MQGRQYDLDTRLHSSSCRFLASSVLLLGLFGSFGSAHRLSVDEEDLDTLEEAFRRDGTVPLFGDGKTKASLLSVSASDRFSKGGKDDSKPKGSVEDRIRDAFKHVEAKAKSKQLPLLPATLLQAPAVRRPDTPRRAAEAAGPLAGSGAVNAMAPSSSGGKTLPRTSSPDSKTVHQGFRVPCPQTCGDPAESCDFYVFNHNLTCGVLERRQGCDCWGCRCEVPTDNDCLGWSPSTDTYKGKGSFCQTWGWQIEWCYVSKEYTGPGHQHKQPSALYDGKYWAPCGHSAAEADAEGDHGEEEADVQSGQAADEGSDEPRVAKQAKKKEDPTRKAQCDLTSNAWLVGYNISTIKNATVQACTDACEEDIRCQSFNWNRQLYSCDLNEMRAVEVGGLREEEPGGPFDYYDCEVLTHSWLKDYLLAPADRQKTAAAEGGGDDRHNAQEDAHSSTSRRPGAKGPEDAGDGKDTTQPSSPGRSGAKGGDDPRPSDDESGRQEPPSHPSSRGELDADVPTFGPERALGKRKRAPKEDRRKRARDRDRDDARKRKSRSEPDMDDAEQDEEDDEPAQDSSWRASDDPDDRRQAADEERQRDAPRSHAAPARDVSAFEGPRTDKGNRPRRHHREPPPDEEETSMDDRERDEPERFLRHRRHERRDRRDDDDRRYDDDRDDHSRRQQEAAPNESSWPSSSTPSPEEKAKKLSEELSDKLKALEKKQEESLHKAGGVEAKELQKLEEERMKTVAESATKVVMNAAEQAEQEASKIQDLIVKSADLADRVSKHLEDAEKKAEELENRTAAAVGQVGTTTAEREQSTPKPVAHTTSAAPETTAETLSQSEHSGDSNLSGHDLAVDVAERMGMVPHKDKAPDADHEKPMDEESNETGDPAEALEKQAEVLEKENAAMKEMLAETEANKTAEQEESEVKSLLAQDDLLEFDCGDSANVFEEWSDEKQDWCCQHHGIACKAP
eukprot:TRINITY_DN2554_c0_g1_i2.p1 TRINITY_DN2554_c0_g1~~TRINITY_DN2554_c0_g1_i2.p1  ORF type:complete len:964 (-),score=257.91 TRINITY_DN2554_c0_g1_i2:323-3214(-)